MNDRPYTLVAELTYRCALRCPYCSNPQDYRAHSRELSTELWHSVLEQAADLGVMQLHLTGGEPLARADLERIAARARALGLYTNLVTSAVPLTRERLAALHAAGIDCVQVSLQDADAASANRIAGRQVFDAKLEAIGWVKELGLPLTLNVVLHQHNLERVPQIIALAEELGADRLELANTQYLGWALINREALMPDRRALVQAHELAMAAKARLRGRMELLFVIPDYYARYPRACMDGWARRFLHVTPNGTVLPCHAAQSLSHLSFEQVTERPLEEIWFHSASFNAYRGDAWMPDPCRTCERKALDFGGCRCQAFALTGDAAAADPACSRAPGHAIVVQSRSVSPGRRYLHRGTRLL